MTNYREILRLSSLQYSQRTIESMAHCSRHTVRDVLQAAKEQGMSWALDADVTGYSCAGVPLFRRNGYRQSSGRKPLFRNRDTALN